MTKWHPHKPGDPMPVDGETEVFVRLRGGWESRSPDRASWRYWGKTNALGESEIVAYRYAKPADKPQSTPKRRWISVEEQPHPIGGGVRFWARWRGYDGAHPVCPWTCHAGITHWCPMEQPPEFVEPPKIEGEK